MNLTEVN